MNTPHLTDLGAELASDGFGGHERAVRDVVRMARERDVSPTLVDLLADRSGPEVVRLRAFGRIALALAASSSTPRVRPAA